MRVDQLAEVHAIQVIAGENQVIVGLVSRKVPRGLTDRVGRALEPVGAVGCLLGGEHLDEAFREEIQAIRLRDVAIERRGIELREDEDPLESCMQAVADRNVDQAVLAADRDSRFGPHVRQWVEARPTTAAEDERQHVVHASDLKPLGCGLSQRIPGWLPG